MSVAKPEHALETEYESLFVLQMVVILQASTLQMAILLMYNSSDQYTIQNLTDTLDIKQDMLLQVKTNDVMNR